MMIYIYSIYAVCLTLFFSCKTEHNNEDGLNKEKKENFVIPENKEEKSTKGNLSDIYSKMVSGSLDKGFEGNRKDINKIITNLENKDRCIQKNMQCGLEGIKRDINSLKDIVQAEGEAEHIKTEAGLTSGASILQNTDNSDSVPVDDDAELKSDIAPVDDDAELKSDIDPVDDDAELKSDIAPVDDDAELKSDIAPVDDDAELKSDIVSDKENIKCDELKINYDTFLEKKENAIWHKHLGRLALKFDCINYFKIFLDKKLTCNLELRVKKIRKDICNIGENIGDGNRIIKIVNNIIVYVKLLKNSEFVYRSPLHLLKLTQCLFKEVQKQKEDIDITKLSSSCTEFYRRVLNGIINKSPDILYLNSKVSQKKVFTIDNNALKTFCDFYCIPDIRNEAMESVKSEFDKEIPFGFHKRSKEARSAKFCDVMQLVKQSPELCNLYNKDLSNIGYDVALHPFHILYLSYCTVVGLYKDIQGSTTNCNQKVEYFIKNLKLQYEILRLINDNCDDVSLSFTACLSPYLSLFNERENKEKNNFSKLIGLLETISKIKCYLKNKYKADCEKTYLYDKCYENTLKSCFCNIEDCAYSVMYNVKKLNKKLTNMQRLAIKNEKLKIAQINAYKDDVKVIKDNIERYNKNNCTDNKQANISEEEACKYLKQIPLDFIENFLKGKRTTNRLQKDS